MITYNVTKTVEKYFKEVLQDMANAGVPNDSANIVSVNESNGKRTRGYCRKHKEAFNLYSYQIFISKQLKTEWDIKSVIAHELIHTYNWEHDNMFFYYIDKMHQYNEKYLRLYGGHGKKNHTSDEMESKIQYKYVVKCKHCGCETYYSRRAKIMDDCSHYRCNKCYTLGKFEIIQNY